MNIKTILVEGMTCNHCKATVENNLKKMTGISSVLADPNTGKVVIEGENINIPETEKTITSLGYKYKGLV